ncbi:MAG: PTS sugar transporter subunit IIA [Alistipes onderdonkii]
MHSPPTPACEGWGCPGSHGRPAAGRCRGAVFRRGFAPREYPDGASSEPKEAAIRRAGELLAAGGYVEPGYADAMLRREESATTYMGMGIAIPHGTSDAKKCVLHSGIVVLQYPGGVAFGNEKAYLVVGIAGVGDAHLDILARLGEVFGDEELLRRLTTEGDPQVIYEALK